MSCSMSLALTSFTFPEFVLWLLTLCSIPAMVSMVAILVPLNTLTCSSLRFKYRTGTVPDSTLTKILGTRTSCFSVKFGLIPK